MKKQEFIDALYAAGWDSPHDAQGTKVNDLWRNIFPTAAAIQDDMEDAIESAHMAGQRDAGVDPGYSNAQAYRIRVTD